MTPGNQDDPERGGDEILAAEYVLGVLPVAERQATVARIDGDTAFRQMVETWEERLSPLNAGYQDVEVPASVKAALDARLFGAGVSQTRAGRAGFLQSLVFWRGLTAAAVAAVLLLLALPLLQSPPAVPPAERFVASLDSVESEVRYLAFYDPSTGEIGLSHMAGQRGSDRAFELWAIEGDDAPVSLGLIPAGERVNMAVDPALRDMMASGVLFAISDEPEGGSPTGQPTGAVLAAGDLRII